MRASVGHWKLAVTEMAFISNDEEAALLADPDWQDTYARAIARGVTDYGKEG